MLKGTDLPPTTDEATARAQFVRAQMPSAGLFAGQTWRISPEPFALSPEVVEQLNWLGRVILQFYRATDLLYRQSAAGKQPAWIAELLDRGKPAELIELQRSPGFKGHVPRVIRPDVLLTENGLSITELDSVPGGIGLTAWLNETYTAAMNSSAKVIGGADEMVRGFESIFGNASRVHLMVSQEAETYRPEMQWMAQRLGERFNVVDGTFTGARAGEAVYRFFEMFDLANVPAAPALFAAAREEQICITPPPKMIFEEKLLFALLWNRNLRDFWRQQLGESFLKRLLGVVPYSWAVDPSPLPPHGAIPELNLTDWQQLKSLSQRDRELILKISGFSAQAWGARGVYLGSDLSHAEWTAAVDKAIGSFDSSPYVLQRYHKPATVPARYFDFEKGAIMNMAGRVRLCPYYFVSGEGDQSRATLGGVLATICPADKKIIHGMPDAILAPCSFGAADEAA